MGADQQQKWDICYVAPCGRKFRTFPEILRYLDLREITNLSLEHFTFSRKVAVGQVIDMDKDDGEALLVGGRRGRKRGMPNIGKPGEWVGG